MSLEDRIQQSVEWALADVRARVEQDVRALTKQLLETLDAEKKTALDEAAADARRQVEEAEARVRGTVDQLIADARAAEVAAAEERLKAAAADADQRTADAVKDAVNAARVREREAEMAAVERLVESVRGLDGAASLSEVLDMLAQAAAREAARAAVLVVRNDRLIGWKLSGFGQRDSQPKSIDLAFNEAGVLGVAIGTARPALTHEGEPGADGPGFAKLPAGRKGLAVPIIVGGRVVAAVYADGGESDAADQTVPTAWPETIEILSRHAARCLEALTVQRVGPQPPRFWVPPGGKGAGQPPAVGSTSGDAKGSVADEETRVVSPKDKTRAAGEGPVARTQAVLESEAGRLAAEEANDGDWLEQSARRFARLLLSEIKLYHRPAVDEGRRSRNLLSRLGPEIDRARRVYDARVPASLRTRAELFHQELVATLAGGDPSVLGFQA